MMVWNEKRWCSRDRTLKNQVLITEKSSPRNRNVSYEWRCKSELNDRKRVQSEARKTSTLINRKKRSHQGRLRWSDRRGRRANFRLELLLLYLLPASGHHHYLIHLKNHSVWILCWKLTFKYCLFCGAFSDNPQVGIRVPPQLQYGSQQMHIPPMAETILTTVSPGQ